MANSLYEKLMQQAQGGTDEKKPKPTTQKPVDTSTMPLAKKPSASGTGAGATGDTPAVRRTGSEETGVGENVYEKLMQQARGGTQSTRASKAPTATRQPVDTSNMPLNRTPEEIALDRLIKSQEAAKGINPAAGTSPILNGVYDRAEGRVSTLRSSPYAQYMKKADYADKSRAGESKIRFIGGDSLYDYINDINGYRGKEDSANAGRMGMSPYAKYAFMTEDEIGVYNYIYATEGKKAAKKYLKQLEPELDKQMYSGQSAVMEEAAVEHPWAMSGLTVASQPIRTTASMIATGEDIYRAATGQGINPYSRLRQPSRMTSDVRAAVAEDLENNPNWFTDAVTDYGRWQGQELANEWAVRNRGAEGNPFAGAADSMTPEAGGKAASFVYQTAMSAADSAVNMALARGLASDVTSMAGVDLSTKAGTEALMRATNIIGSLTMSSEVMSLGVAESKEKGYSDMGALAVGFIRGAVEYASEAIGGEWAIRNIKANPLNFVKSMVLNMIPEGVEEVMSDVMNGTVNLIIDQIFGTEESGIPALMQEFSTDGWQQNHPWIAQILGNDASPMAATVLYLLGEEGLSFLGGALATVGTSGVQTYNIRQGINAVGERMGSTPQDIAQLMEEYEADPWQIGELGQFYEAENAEDFRAKAGTGKKAADILEETREQRTEKRRAAIETGARTRGIADDFRRAGVELTDSEVKVLVDGMDTGDTDEDSYRSGILSAFRMGQMGNVSLQEAMRATDSGAKLSANQFRQAWQLGRMRSGAETADINTEEWQTRLEASFSALGDNAELAIASYEEGQDVDAYAAAMTKAAMLYAANGQDLHAVAEQVRSGERADIISNLSDAQLDVAMQIGRQMSEQRAAAVQRTGARLRAAREANTAGTKRVGSLTLAKEGGDIDGIRYEAVQARNLTKQQKSILSAVGTVSKTLGLQVTVISAKGTMGGAYTGGGRIYLNIDSGMNLKGFSKAIAAGSFAHEMTHWLEEYAVEEYEALRKIVTRDMSAEQLDKLVREQQRVQPKLSYDEALNEVVANACQPLLENSKAFEQLARENMNLAEKILDYMKKFTEKMKAAFAEIDWKDDLSIYRAVQAVEGRLDEMQKAFDEAILAARENMNAEAAPKSAPKAAVKAAEPAQEQEYKTDDNGQMALFQRLDHPDERVSAETEKQLQSIGSTAVDGVVVSDELARLMREQGFSKPVDPVDELFTQYQVWTTDEWEDNFIKQGGSREVAALIRTFTDAMIADDAIMGYVPSGHYQKSKFGPLRKNIEYRWTFDMDASCPRTFQFVNYRNALQKIAGRPLTDNEAINLMYLMRKMNQQIPCTYCYVENKRVMKSKSYLDWFKARSAVMNAATDEEARKGMYSYNEEKGTLGAAAQKVFDEWRSAVKAGKAFAPTAQECWTGWQTARNTTFNWLDAQLESGEMRFGDGVKKQTSQKKMVEAVCKHFGITEKSAQREIEGFVAKWRYDILAETGHNYDITNDTSVDSINQDFLTLHRLATNYASSVSQARLVDDYTPYTDQLKNVSKEDKKFIMAMGGIRKHSSNDFRMDYVQDYLLFYADLARGGWTGHTYTKSVDFCKVFGRSGDRINLSIAMNTENGKIVENQQEGAAWNDARELREAYKDVGVMAMVTDNAQLSFALNNDWIDMCIPFHASGLPKAVWYNIRAWSDYTSVQLESYFNSTEMKQRLQDAGVDIKGLTTDEVEALFNSTFNIPVILNKSGNRVKPHFFPNDTEIVGPGGVKQIVPGHHNDAKRYLELCEQYGVHPRFYGTKVTDAQGNVIDVTEHPGYVKLIKETSRTDTEQEPIKFNFNEHDDYLGMTPMEYAMKRMQEEARIGGYKNTSEDPMGIVKLFEELYLGQDREIGWTPSDYEEEGDAADRLLTAIEYTKNAYKEMYDADLQTVDVEGYQKVLAEQATPKPQMQVMSEAAQDESERYRLDREIAEVVDSMEDIDTTDAEYRKLQSRLTKLYADRDKIIDKERRLSRRTSINDLLANLDSYRRIDLESLAEQYSDGSWDDYEDLSTDELREQLREALTERADEMTVLERQAPKYGFFVRPVGEQPGNIINFSDAANRTARFQQWDGVEDAAVERFGTTDNFRTAGYMLTDGKMLDFSGAHWLEGYDDDYIADWRRKNDIRQVDHEDVFEAFEAMGGDFPSDSALAFIKRGNMRMVPEAPGVEMSAVKEPTAEQYRELKRYVREYALDPKRFPNASFTVDFTNDRTHRAGTLRYTGSVNADRVINDIKYYYANGEIRQQSAVNRFRYQLIDAGNDDTAEEATGRETAYARLQSENAILTETVRALNKLTGKQATTIEKLQKQLHLSKTAEVRDSDARKLARSLVKEYGSSADVKALAADIKALGDYILQTKPSDIRETEIKDRARDIAAQVVSSARETVDLAMDLDQNTEMASMPEDINPFDQYRGEAIEDLANRISMDALGGVLRQETTAMDRQKARRDALREQINQLKAEKKTTGKEAYQLYETIYDLSLALDKAESKYRSLQVSADERLAQVRAEGRARAAEVRAIERARAAEQLAEEKERYRAKQAELREEKWEKVAETREFYREMIARQHEKRQEAAGTTKYRKQVDRKAKALYELLVTNSNDKHVPEVLKQPLGEFLESISFASKRSLAGGEDTKNDEKMAARLLRIQQMLANQQSYINGDGSVQEDLGGYIDVSNDVLEELRQMAEGITQAMSMGRGFTVNQMTADQLKTLSKFLSNLTTAIKNMNRMMANARYESVKEAASADVEYMKSLGRVSERGQGGVSKFTMWENGIPYYVFRRYGEGGRSIFDSFTKGWEKMAMNAQEIIAFTDKTYTDKEVRAWKKEMHDFTLDSGDKIRMTTGQIMELAMLLGREQAMKHITKGGIRIGDIETGKGKISDTKHYHLTADDIQKITDALTDRQMEVAKALQSYMARRGGEWGNEISMRRFGYNFYEEGEGYYPIRTDSNDRPMADTDAQTNSMFRLLNLSSSKALNPKASNALVVDDIFATFSDHMADMAKLNGMGLSILDAIKWFNFKERVDGDNGTYDTRTLQGAMEQAYGAQAQRYFRTLMKDINGQTESGDRGMGVFSRFLGNYKAAAVGANLRVALLQPTSYVRAQTILKPKYMIAAFARRNGYQEAMKYSGTAVWKSLGYYDTDISKSMRGQIEHDDTFKDKLVEKSMVLAELGDKLTWGRLWNACKLQVKGENSSLTGEALMQATADLFRQVIYSSQVMDGTLTRSEIMRAKGGMSKMASAFMAEPTLSYNILLDAASQYNIDRRRTNSAEAWRRNAGKIGKAFTVYLSSAAFAAVVESLADAMRDDDDDSYFEKFMEAFLGKDGKFDLTGNLAQDLTIIGKLPYFKDLVSIIQGYSSGNMGLSAFVSVFDAYKIWEETYKLSTGELDKATKITSYGKMTNWGKIYKTLQGFSQLSGIPGSNMMRDVFAIWNSLMNGRKDEWKIKRYDDSNAEMGERLVKAYESGDSAEIDRRAGAFESEKKALDAVKDQLKGEVLEGERTPESAAEVLRKAGLGEDDIFFLLQKWETGDSGKYTALKRALIGGDKAAFRDAMKDLTDHGIKEREANNQLKTFLRKAYLGAELSDEEAEILGDTTITDAEARRLLHDYAGMDTDDAVNLVREWQFQKKSGFSYDNRKELYLEGSLTRAELRKALMSQGGKTSEEADAIIKDYDFEKKYGWAWSERKERYQKGKVPKAEMLRLLQSHGGKTAEEAQNQLIVWDWQKDVRGADNITATAIGKYNSFCASAGVSKETYVRAWAQYNDTKGEVDKKGKSIPYSKTKKYMAYLNTLPISAQQKTAIALCFWSKSVVKKYKKW